MSGRWLCTTEAALRSNPEHFSDANVELTNSAKNGADVATTMKTTGASGFNNIDGSAADSFQVVVKAVGQSMTHIPDGLSIAGAAFRVASETLSDLRTRSEALLLRAQAELSELLRHEADFTDWDRKVTSRWNDYDVASDHRDVDPSGYSTAKQRYDFAAGQRRVSLVRVNNSKGELDNSQRDFDQLRIEEEDCHQRVADSLSGSAVDRVASPPELSDGAFEALAGLLTKLDLVLAEYPMDHPYADLERSALRDAVGMLTAMADRDNRLTDTNEAVEDIRNLINKGDDLAMSNNELNSVADQIEDLTIGEREYLFSLLTGEEFERLFHNVHSTGWMSNDWDNRERAEFYQLLAPLATYGRYSDALAEAELATQTDPAATDSLADLNTALSFLTLTFDERAAVLAQAANYPGDKSIDDLNRLTAQDWFHDFDLADSQRSAKTVAFLSLYAGGDQTIIDNTLDSFLGDGAPFQFDWEREGTAYGSAGGDVFHFNRMYLEPGNDPVNSSVPSGIPTEKTIHMVTATVAHEVSHLHNGDVVSESFEYFMAEYRAGYVGFLAENGVPPTRDEMYNRAAYLVTAPDGAYKYITNAVSLPDEGPQIADFMSEVLGRPVTPTDLATEVGSRPTDGADPAPVPVSVDGGPNNMDNS